VEGIWKEAGLATQNLSQDCRCHVRDSNLVPPGDKSELSPTEPAFTALIARYNVRNRLPVENFAMRSNIYGLGREINHFLLNLIILF
jgi:hypothetical protein